MSSSLLQTWDASVATPFEPLVAKDQQLFYGAVLLTAGFLLSTLFALNRSIVSLTLLGLPAAIVFGFGSVFMICAVGVYV